MIQCAHLPLHEMTSLWNGSRPQQTRYAESPGCIGNMLSEKSQVEQKQERTGRDSGKYVKRGCKSMFCEKSAVFWGIQDESRRFQFQPTKKMGTGPSSTTRYRTFKRFGHPKKQRKKNMKKHNNSCLQVLQKALKMDDCQKKSPKLRPKRSHCRFHTLAHHISHS